MQSVLRITTGVVAATAGFGVTKVLGWTDVGFEFSVFLGVYLVVAIGLDRALKGYGTKSA